MTFLRAGLGLDPTEGLEAKLGTEMIRAALCAAASSQGAQLDRVSLTDCLESLPIGPCDPVVLVHQNGHLYLLLAVLQIDGQLMCQLIHGESDVWLVSPVQLRNAGFCNVWKFRRTSETFPIRIGSAEVRVNKLFHNFGEVKPASEEHCSFMIENVGKSTIVVEKPKTSCGCVTPNAIGAIPLAPGRGEELEVALNTKQSFSLRHSVLLKFYEHETGTSRQVLLWLFGSQRASMQVVPEQLNFGKIRPGKSVFRTVTLSEVSTDRFSITAVDVGDLPVTHKVDSYETNQGMKVFRVRLELVAPHSATGVQRGRLVIVTDSGQRPRVVIPIQFELESPIAVIPSTVSFGAVAVGDVATQEVELVSDSRQLLDISVQSTNSEIQVSVDDKNVPPRLIIRWRPESAGILQTVLRVNAESSASREGVNLVCVGYSEGKRHAEFRGGHFIPQE